MIANKLRSGSNQPTKEYTASGALANGDLVILNADNTVSVVEGSNVSETIGTAALVHSSGGMREASTAFDSNSNKVVVLYENYSNNYYLTAAVGTVSGNSISFGSPVTVYSGQPAYSDTVFDDNLNKIVVVYGDMWSSGNGTARVGTVSGTSISVGSGVVFNYGYSYHAKATFDSSSNKVVVVYQDGGNSNKGTARVGNVSGSSISFGSEVVFHDADTPHIGICFDSNVNKVVVTHRGYDSSASPDPIRAIVGTVSGTSISFGTATTVDSTYSTNALTAPVFDSSTNKIAMFYQGYTGGTSGYGIAIILAINSSNNTVTVGTRTIWSSYAYTGGNIFPLFAPNTNDFIVAHRSYMHISVGRMLWTSGSGSYYSHTSTSDASMSSGSIGQTRALVGCYDTNLNKSVFARDNSASTKKSYATVYQHPYTSENLTASNFIGISNGAYADTATATIQTNRATDNAQSGLTAGSTYYAQTDGTLSTTADSPSVLVGTARTTTSIKIKGSNA